MSKCLQLESIAGGVLQLTIDIPGKKVNTLSQPVMHELAEVVEGLESSSDTPGLLFRSGKPGQFIAGADLNELAALMWDSREAVAQKMEAGHGLFDRISRLPFPTVAMIDGHCMGGGTELILAMDQRVATNSRATRIALPEVKVGLIPGWGGTQRMPRLIGLQHAIEMISSGNPLSAHRAAELGLVFDAVDESQLLDVALRLIADARNSENWLAERETFRQPLGLSEDQSRFAFVCAEGQVRAKTKGHYPAPLAALKAMRQGLNLPLDEGLRVEREVAMEVTGSEISSNLIGVFFMNSELARDRGVASTSAESVQVDRVGVLGAGLMGSGIATAHARAGIVSGMVDVDDQRLADGVQRAAQVVQSRIQIGRATASDLQALLSHLNTSTSQRMFADCDVVVEAITENEQLKTDMYRQIAGDLKPGAILASNTSTISITRMAEAAPDPQRFAGMHFFFPVDRMQLVEVIRGDQTSDETVLTLVELARRIKKVPIVCNDCPGFLVNRILLPYMNEALLLLNAGATLDQVDKAATRFGMPVGPIALHDMVGLDTAYYAGQVMLAGFSDRAVMTPMLGELVKAGRLGKKSGSGFRKFTGRKARPADDPELLPFLEKHRTDQRELTSEEISDRLLLPMLLEATRVLEDNIVREPAHVDMGLILGIGFPSFRGGLLRWCDNLGAGEVLKKLEQYQDLGRRFEPTDSLLAMAAANGRFYPKPENS
jgi:3-hydroxyacyl-CoA dehydrogenase/enoyl-CoA hydratase/3-hydroxybutyryl-CoA epimerase/3-hydroxyacyl-CoA dehydrogenase/enoyl-CoA hydratase/3-hydroxybutyryl-CoA epimerase/enoyl-CoA isomerase